MVRLIAGALALLVSPALAQSPKVGDPPEAQNMRLVGMSDLQARSAYQPTIHRQGDRYIAYIGHPGGTPAVRKPINKQTGQAEFNGTSILDVTDPANPKYLKHIPGLEGNYEEGGAQMVRVCDGATLPNGDKGKTYMLRGCGTAPRPPIRCCWRGSAKGSATRTRTGGSATPASPTSSPARPAGARGA